MAYGAFTPTACLLSTLAGLVRGKGAPGPDQLNPYAPRKREGPALRVPLTALRDVFIKR